MTSYRYAALCAVSFVASFASFATGSVVGGVEVLAGLAGVWVLVTVLGPVCFVVACRAMRFHVICLVIGAGPGRTLRARSDCPVRLGCVPAGFQVAYLASDRSGLARRAWFTDAGTVAPVMATAAFLVLLHLPPAVTAGGALGVTMMCVMLFRLPVVGCDGGPGWCLVAGRRNVASVYAPPAEIPFRRLSSLGRWDEALTATASLELTPDGQERQAWCLIATQRYEEALGVLRRLDRGQLTVESRVRADDNRLSILCLLAERHTAPTDWTEEGWLLCDRLRATRRWRSSPAICSTVAQFFALAGHPDAALRLTELPSLRNTLDGLLTRALAQDLLGYHKQAVRTLGRVARARRKTSRLQTVRELIDADRSVGS